MVGRLMLEPCRLRCCLRFLQVVSLQRLILLPRWFSGSVEKWRSIASSCVLMANPLVLWVASRHRFIVRQSPGNSGTIPPCCKKGGSGVHGQPAGPWEAKNPDSNRACQKLNYCLFGASTGLFKRCRCVAKLISSVLFGTICGMSLWKQRSLPSANKVVIKIFILFSMQLLLSFYISLSHNTYTL